MVNPISPAAHHVVPESMEEMEEIDLTACFEEEDYVIGMPQFVMSDTEDKMAVQLEMFHMQAEIKMALVAMTTVLGLPRSKTISAFFIVLWTLHCSFYFISEFCESLSIANKCWSTTVVIYFIMVSTTTVFFLRHNVKWYLSFVQLSAKDYIYYLCLQRLRFIFKVFPYGFHATAHCTSKIILLILDCFLPFSKNMIFQACTGFQ